MQCTYVITYMHSIDVSSGILQNACMETINYTLRIPRDLKDALKESAEREGRSLNSHFIYILRRYLAGYDFGLPAAIDEKMEAESLAHNKSKTDEIVDRLSSSLARDEPGSVVLTSEDLLTMITDCVTRGATKAIEQYAASQEQSQNKANNPSQN